MADEEGDNGAPDRQIIAAKVGRDGLYTQPKDFGPEREMGERHGREGFAAHFNYADPFTGLAQTYDEKGDYNCGRCNWANGDKCLLVKTKIDREAGSCGDWEGLDAAVAVMRWIYKSIDSSGYGVARNGKGFGCKRCPFASKAYEPDSRGRDLYCGKGDFRVFADACCVLNGAPAKRRSSPLYD